MSEAIDLAAEATDERAAAAGELAPTRPLVWSVRRELWENRSLWVGPLLVAGILLLGFLVSTASLPERMRELPTMSAVEQHKRVVAPFSAAAGVPIVAAFLIGAFYCLDALYGERRDRSILFWRSLPVSDRTTVLAKASVPLVVLPAITYPIVIAVQLVMLAASSAVLVASGVGLAIFWERLPLFQMWIAIFYGLAAFTLWHAPIYGWLLLVSAWARRAPALWALLPPAALAIFERFAFGSAHVGRGLQHRFLGWFTLGFTMDPQGPPGQPLSDMTPGRLLGAPGFWLGLLFTAACVAGAVRLRRRREPA